MGPLLALVLTLSAGEIATPRWVGMSVGDALRKLADDAIVFNSEQVPDGLFVRADPVGGDLEAQLNSLLSPHGLKVVPGPGDRLVVVRDEQPRSVLLPVFGQVFDSGSQPVANALVAAYPGGGAVTTDDDGRFQLAAGRGQVTLLVEHPGFFPAREELPTIGERGDDPVRIVLSGGQTELVPITITASHYALHYATPDSKIYFSREEIDRTPHIADDVMRAVRWVPGVASGDFSSQINVRGGASNELGVYLDGMRLYEPYHMKDLLNIFSVIDSNAIDGVDFFTGALPARYGNSASAVLDVSSVTPSDDHQHRLGLSFINAFGQTSGTIGKDGWWLASGRTGYLDVVLDITKDDSGLDPSYSDVLAKMQLPLANGMQLTASTLMAFDHSLYSDDDFGNPDISDGDFFDGYLWFDLDYDLGLVAQARTSLYGGVLERDRRGELIEQNALATLSDVRDFRFAGIRQSFSWLASDRLNVTAGLDLARQRADYRFVSEAQIVDAIVGDRLQVRDVDVSLDETQVGVHLAATINVGDALTADLGVRYDRYGHLDSSDVSPRINLLMEPREGTRVRFGVGRFSQPQEIYQLQVEDGLSEFFDSEESDQLVLALEQDFPSGLSLRAEAYHKDYENPRPYFTQLYETNEILQELMPDRVRVDPEAARAYGVELGLRKRTEAGTAWWLGYSWAHAEERLSGEWVPRNWDQRHAVTAGVAFQAGSWDWTFGWRYHSGWPATPVERLTITEPDGSVRFEVEPGIRNSERHGIYHRLDMRASRDIPVKTGSLRFYAEILNLYSRKNECCTDVFAVRTQQGNEFAFDEPEEWLPFLPSLGLKWQF